MLLETGAYPTHNLLSFDYFELSLHKYVGWFGNFDLIGRNLGCPRAEVFRRCKINHRFLLNKLQQFLLSGGLCEFLCGGKSVENTYIKAICKSVFLYADEKKRDFQVW